MTRTVKQWTKNVTEIRTVDSNGNVTKVMLDNYGETANVPRGVTWTPGVINR